MVKAKYGLNLIFPDKKEMDGDDILEVAQGENLSET